VTTPVFAPPIWITTAGDRLPTRMDADRHERVWVIALDACDRPYPSETYWRHVRGHALRQRKPGQNVLYSHWAVPPVKTWKYQEEKEHP
jgi:hypothetical protein